MAIAPTRRSLNTRTIALGQALNARREAERTLCDLLRGRWPVDGVIYWQRQTDGPEQAGTVISHGHGDRVQVKNARTGATYWIYAYWITG